jgi:hypothetical protein
LTSGRRRLEGTVKRKRRLTIREIMDEGTLIDEALLKAARDALLLHKRAGLSVPVWRNGRTVLIPPEQIEIPDVAHRRSRRA